MNESARFFLALLTLLVALPTLAEEPQTPQKPNILFIAVDDMKPLTGRYGDARAVTPNIDALADKSMLFHRAYVQYPVCGPSRSSMLTGLHPESSGVLDLKTRMRDVHPDIVTLPQFFRNAGYQTAAAGKIFDPRNVDSRSDSDPASWSVPYRNSNGKVDKRGDPNYVAKAIDAPADRFVDGQINKRGLRLLQELSSDPQPFFLAVGYKKPHFPFIVPQRYFDLYEQADFPLAAYQQAPAGSDPDYTLNNNNELKGYVPKDAAPGGSQAYGDSLSPAQQRELLHGYYASVSFVDALVGELLASLAQSPAADNTIVVLWGDHGFHLGDHGMWGKHTVLEQAARVPLMIHVPGRAGAESEALVESIDLFPTLAELAGLQPPPGLQGNSLRPVLDDPGASVRSGAVTQYRRKGAYGYSLRTDRWRYTEWVTDSGRVAYRELYDMVNDPEERENVLALPSNTTIAAALAAQLREHSPGLTRLQQSQVPAP